MDTNPLGCCVEPAVRSGHAKYLVRFELFVHTRNRRRLATDEIIAAMDGCGLGGVCTARPRRSIYDISEASQAFSGASNTLNWRHSLQRKPPEVGK